MIKANPESSTTSLPPAAEPEPNLSAGDVSRTDKMVLCARNWKFGCDWISSIYNLPGRVCKSSSCEEFAECRPCHIRKREKGVTLLHKRRESYKLASHLTSRARSRSRGRSKRLGRGRMAAAETHYMVDVIKQKIHLHIVVVINHALLQTIVAAVAAGLSVARGCLLLGHVVRQPYMCSDSGMDRRRGILESFIVYHMLSD